MCPPDVSATIVDEMSICHASNAGRSTPNLFALVSDETRRIWVSTQGWKPAVSSVYYGFYYCDKAQVRVQTQPRIET